MSNEQQMEMAIKLSHSNHQQDIHQQIYQHEMKANALDIFNVFDNQIKPSKSPIPSAPPSYDEIADHFQNLSFQEEKKHDQNNNQSFKLPPPNQSNKTRKKVYVNHKHKLLMLLRMIFLVI